MDVCMRIAQCGQAGGPGSVVLANNNVDVSGSGVRDIYRLKPKLCVFRIPVT